MAAAFRWDESPAPYESGAVYAPGASPGDFHPREYGRLDQHRHGRVSTADGSTFRVVVHSTRPRRDGWVYVVVELVSAPMWVSYFYRRGGDRIEHARSGNAQQLADALSVKRLG